MKAGDRVVVVTEDCYVEGTLVEASPYGVIVRDYRQAYTSTMFPRFMVEAESDSDLLHISCDSKDVYVRSERD